MRRLVTLADGAAAAEELASELLGFSVRKAIDPLSHGGFLLISEAIAKRLAATAQSFELQAVSEVLSELDLDWEDLSAAQIEATMKAVEASLATSFIEKIIGGLGAVLLNEGPNLMRLVRAAMKANDHLEIVTSLSQRDLKAEEAIRKSQVNFIRNSTGQRVEELSKVARDLVSKAVAQGLSTDVIGQRLKKRFEEDIPRPESYWRVVAESFVGRARARSQIDSLVDADVETYELVAVLDEVTTDICRFMDGQQFSVSAAQKLLNQIDALEDPEDVKFAQPWVRKGVDEDGDSYLYVPREDGSRVSIAKIDRSGVGAKDDRGEYSGARSTTELVSLGIPCPPFHGHCRTVIVAVIN